MSQKYQRDVSNAIYLDLTPEQVTQLIHRLSTDARRVKKAQKNIPDAYAYVDIGPAIGSGRMVKARIGAE